MSISLVSDPAIQPSEPASIQFPTWAQSLFQRGKFRYKVLYGGRGSSKSWSAARALILLACQGTERVLCTRELQTSIAESVHRLLSDQIELMGLSEYFEIQQNNIYRKPYAPEDIGSEFIFYGIKNNPTKIKSAEGISICWIEEAEKVSAHSWQILIPTIRTPGSEIWVTFNPDEETDPTYQRFVVSPPPDSYIAEVNWLANPWFPGELRKEKEYLYRVDPDAAEHVYGGKCRKNGSSQIFRGKYEVCEFTVPDPNFCDAESPMWDGPYYGADWGFSQDPTVLGKSWIDSKNKFLYIEKESYQVGLELDDIAPRWKRDIPEAGERSIRADSSRPETISYVARTGSLSLEAAEKWTGCVEDGVAYMRKFVKIIVHPRCVHHIQEFRLYSYKVDRLSGEVTTDIVDRNNHCMDQIRYAHDPMIRSGGSLAVWARL